MSIPAAARSCSAARCGMLPGPVEPKFSAPGRARAPATSSWTVRNGEAAGTTTGSGTSTASVIGAKSRSGS